MNGGRVSSARNNPVERVDLAHEIPLAKSADRRIAGHGTNLVTPKTHKSRARTHPRGSSRSFATRMASTNDNDIETLHDRAATPEVADCQPVSRETSYFPMHMLPNNASSISSTPERPVNRSSSLRA